MKKTVFALLLAFLSLSAYSQKGDLTVGAKGGYVYSPNYYNGILYGIDVAYHINDPLEVVLTGMMNPSVPYVSEDVKQKTNQTLAVYSANLDFRLYLIHQQTWATGPALGGQYYSVSKTSIPNYGSDHALGFNIGWHFRVNLTDNLKLNAGWRYTNAKAKEKDSVYGLSFDMSYHLFYLGLAYTFELR